MTDATSSPPSGEIDYIDVQTSAPFGELRRRHRSFVFPLAAVSLLWYFVYVLLAAFAHDFMSIPVWGHINVGLILGLGQFAWVFIVTAWYVWYANRKLDPRAEEIRAELEQQEGLR